MLAYTKAEKGVAEIQHRRFGLSPKLRRVLILVDGQRTLEGLKSVLKEDSLESMLDDLSTGGFIETVTLEDLAATPGNAEVGGSTVRPLSAAAPHPSPEDLERAKNFIINTLVHFHGQYAKLDLMRAVKGCNTHSELRELYPDWLRCMQESWQAKTRLTELNEQLLAVI